jgi:acyl-CoA synthetase (AMP-forming)/AMP-acid ligase II
MFAQLIIEGSIPEKQSAVVTCDSSATWAELRGLAESAAAGFADFGQQRIGVAVPPGAIGYAVLAGFDRLGCDVFLMDASWSRDRLIETGRELKLAGVLFAASPRAAISDCEFIPIENAAPCSGASTVTILTSGSTGKPKAVRHTWQTLARAVRRGTGPTAPVWLLTYRPTLYAGLQVMLQCFADRGTLALPSTGMDPSSTAQFMCATGVQFASATPSYWRRLLMFADHRVLARVPILQITLGGEVVDQQILDRIRAVFPKTRIVHIYATTEMGRCFSVTDGKAGFPVSYLSQPIDSVELKIEKGELFVRSPNAMSMYDPHSRDTVSSNEWFATGDLVEFHEDRVYFTGRKSEIINVAGSKVHPVEVERTIRAVPGVLDVRVFGKRSSIAGQLVACDVVPDQNQQTEQLKATILQSCRAKLASYQLPRLINFVQRISVSSADKIVRSENS